MEVPEVSTQYKEIQRGSSDLCARARCARRPRPTCRAAAALVPPPPPTAHLAYSGVSAQQHSPLIAPQVEPWMADILGGAARLQPGLGQEVARLADMVRPTDEETKRARRAVDILVLCVAHQLQQAAVARICVGGSFGRKTGVRGGMDVDMVLFVNEEVSDASRWVL